MVDKEEVMSSFEETPEYDDPFEDDNMAGEPYPEVSIEKVRGIVENESMEKEIADAYATAQLKYTWFDDCSYDFEEDTPEYIQACNDADAWDELSDLLTEKMLIILRDEGVPISENGQFEDIFPFMERNGYIFNNGWWTEKDDTCLG